MVLYLGASEAYLGGTWSFRRDAGRFAHAHASGTRVCACVLPLPSIPGEGGICDVRSFDPETAAAAEGLLLVESLGFGD